MLREDIFNFLGITRSHEWKCEKCHVEVDGSFKIVDGKEQFVYECANCDYKRVFDNPVLIEKEKRSVVIRCLLLLLAFVLIVGCMSSMLYWHKIKYFVLTSFYVLTGGWVLSVYFRITRKTP